MGEERRDTTKIINDRPVLAERFEVIRLLGEGAAGAVFLVKDIEKEGELVALKILTNTEAFDEHTLKRFLDELHVAQSLKHPNIVQAYDFIKMSDSIAYTMEYVEGKDLSTIADERLLSYEEIDQILIQVLSALGELHKGGILHRDLKLENVLISKDGTAKLVDLGLMKKLNAESKMTKTGILLGTAQYLPPEYIKHGEYTVQSDLYAVGLMLYELLAGERRLHNLHGNEAIDYLLDTGFKVPRVSNFARGPIPAKYEELIECALNPKPKKRFTNSDEMAAALSRSILSASKDSRSSTSLNGSQCLPPEITQNQRSYLNQKYSNSPNKYYTNGNDSNWLARVLVVAVLFLGAYVSFSYFNRSALPVSIPFGYYEGDWHPLDGVRKPVYAQMSANGFFVFLNEPRCSGGFVNSLSGLVECIDRTYYVSLRSPNDSGESLVGTLTAAGKAGKVELHYARR